MAFFPILKQNFIAYRSSKVSDCIFEIYQQWQSGFSRVYSNCSCSCSFEPEIIKICQSSHKIYSNNIRNFQEYTTILNACTKKVWKPIECTTYHVVCERWVETGTDCYTDPTSSLDHSTLCYLQEPTLHFFRILAGVSQPWIAEGHSPQSASWPSLWPSCHQRTQQSTASAYILS